MRLVPWLVLLAGCAPLNTLTMREPCRVVYDDCLNGCQRHAPAQPSAYQLQIEVASCTNRCNDQARACE